MLAGSFTFVHFLNYYTFSLRIFLQSGCHCGLPTDQVLVGEDICAGVGFCVGDFKNIVAHFSLLLF